MQQLIHLSGKWITERRAEIFVLLAALAICGGYFLTDLMVHDHTFRNNGVQSFPSYRTAAEGRWGHDIVIFLAGRSGNFTLQTLGAMFLLCLNGALFAAIAGIDKKWPRRIIVGLVAASPLFIDYFSFSIDAISYALSDTLILIGFLSFVQRASVTKLLADELTARNLSMKIPAPSVVGAVFATPFFVAALSIYPPKISLLATLYVVVLIFEFARERKTLQSIVTTILAPAIAIIVATAVYFTAFKVIATLFPRQRLGRTEINSPEALIEAAFGAYADFLSIIAGYAGALAPYMSVSLAVIIALAIVAMVMKAWRHGVLQAGCVLLLLFALPVALHLSGIVNSVADASREARVFIGYAFLPAFAAAFAFSISQRVTIVAGILAIYGGFVIVSQESTGAAMKSLHDSAVGNRIAQRVEALNADGDAKAIFVHGNLDFDAAPFVASINRPFRPHILQPSLTHWNYVEVVNFYLVGTTLRDVTAEERETTLLAIADRKPWPAQSAVFRQGDVIVVYLADRP